MLRRSMIAALTSALALVPVAEACTGIQLTAKDGGVVAARTLEFGIDLESNVIVIPAGTTLTGSLPDGGKGISYTTKYGMAGANGFGLSLILDGINDQGLYVGLFYFPGYGTYPDATAENSARGMAPIEYGAWLLGNFASVDEVKANFDKVVLLPVIVPQLNQAPPVHFVVHDKTGKAVVIEPVDKTLKIYDDPLGVLTNSPTFDWHMTNLSNYVNLTATNVPPATAGELKISSFGQGSGMHGLPGDFTPPSRFVRAVAFSLSAIPSDTAAEIGAAGLPHPQQFRHPLRLRPRHGKRRGACRIYAVDGGLRSQEPEVVLQDLPRSVDPQRRPQGGARGRQAARSRRSRWIRNSR